VTAGAKLYLLMKKFDMNWRDFIKAYHQYHSHQEGGRHVDIRTHVLALAQVREQTRPPLGCTAALPCTSAAHPSQAIGVTLSYHSASTHQHASNPWVLLLGRCSTVPQFTDYAQPSLTASLARHHNP
jgi:hypothetical protein